MTSQPGAELARRIEWRVWRATLLANLIGVGFIAFDAVAIGPVLPEFTAEQLQLSPARLLALCSAVAIPYFMLGASLGVLHIRRRFRPTIRWLAEARDPTSEERLALTRQPRHLATYPLIYWGLLPFWALPYLYYVVGFRAGWLGLFKVAVAFELSALVSFTLAYFLVERELRPVLSLAFVHDPPETSESMGVFGRLVLSWAAACGTPLVAIAVTFIGLRPAQWGKISSFVWGMAALGMLAGVLVAATAARSITDPLHRVREGMRRVEEGETDLDLPVDEAGEIRLLQIGFNRMVSGLRERERMREVFGRHVGPAVARRALDQEEFALGGELREVTTMFVDVIASTKLAQTGLPQDAVTQLNAFFDAVIGCVECEGGYVNQFQGDGVLCIFGAPDDQIDHAACALRAARTLRTEIDTNRPGGLDAAIGISSGKVVAGYVGGMSRYEYTIVGDSTNEASRLNETAKQMPSRTLASRATIELAGPAEAQHWNELGALELRGRAEPTVSYEPRSSA